MQENIIDDVDNVKMPLLVYVSRERKPFSPHHFKAGALNALVCCTTIHLSSKLYIQNLLYKLSKYNDSTTPFIKIFQLRVSAVMSNSPYILVLDCDMFCNDATSAQYAMCFHLDPKISSTLAFVQFPQKFHNISKNDIYDSQLRSLFTVST